MDFILKLWTGMDSLSKQVDNRGLSSLEFMLRPRIGFSFGTSVWIGLINYYWNSVPFGTNRRGLLLDCYWSFMKQVIYP
jgi:hypothetical protein